jgi:hypothetical protein
MAGFTGSITREQSSSSATLTTTALTSNPGDVIVLGVSIPSASVQVSGVSDTAGNVYTRQSRAAGTGISGEVWTAPSPLPSTTNTITITLSSAISDWAVVAGSYAGLGGYIASGISQIATTSDAVSLSIDSASANQVLIAHVFTTPGVTTSAVTTGYSDRPGTGTSYLVHQTFLINGGILGTNNFAETLSAYQNFVAVFLALAPTAWSGVVGKGQLTVSPVGITNTQGVTFANNGADYGPDSPAEPSGLSVTSGILEAINAGIGLKSLLPGTFSMSPASSYPGIPIDGNSSQAGSYVIRGAGPASNLYYNTNAGSVFLIGQTNGFNSNVGGVVLEDFSIYAPPSNTSLNSLLTIGNNNGNPSSPQALAVGIYLSRLSLKSGCSALINIQAGGDVFIDQCRLTNPNGQGYYAEITNAVGGELFFKDCDFGSGASGPNYSYKGIYIANAQAGGYVIRGCNFTHFVNTSETPTFPDASCLDIEGQCLDLFVEGCQFDDSLYGIILNANIITSSIQGNIFTPANEGQTPIQAGPYFLPQNLRIANNPGANPFGLITVPFTQYPAVSPTVFWMGPLCPQTFRDVSPTSSSSATPPSSGIQYRVEICDLVITVNEGTGTSVTITDEDGNVIVYEAPQVIDYFVPWRYTVTISWSGSGVPNIVVWGV